MVDHLNIRIVIVAFKIGGGGINDDGYQIAYFLNLESDDFILIFDADNAGNNIERRRRHCADAETHLRCDATHSAQVDEQYNGREQRGSDCETANDLANEIAAENFQGIRRSGAGYLAGFILRACEHLGQGKRLTLRHRLQLALVESAPHG